MRDNEFLFLILLALVACCVWLWLRQREKQTREERARREAQEAERQRLAAEAEAEAWRRNMAETARKRKEEQEAARREYQEERAARLEQERRARQAAVAAKQPDVPMSEARRLAEAERERQQGEMSKARRLAEEERARLRADPIGGDIQSDMREFLKSSQFFGEEHSPLAYVGYKVGKTNGLPVQERRRRLRACFQIEIPQQLAEKYQAWGSPVTSLRFTSMCQHITMLADMRRARPNYEVAGATGRPMRCG